jgi:hypothetical protein
MKREPDGRPMKRRCTATVKATGERCKLPPIRGGSVCHKHGASAPRVRDAAARRVAAAEALAAYQRHTGDPVPVDLLAALERVAGEIQRWADFAGRRVEQLTRGEWRADEPRVAAEFGTYERALKLASRFLTDVSRLALDERQRAYERETGERYRAEFERQQREFAVKWTATTDRMLAGLGLDPCDRAVRAWVYAHIRGETPPPLPLPARQPGSTAPSFVGAPGTPGHPFPAGWRQQPYGYGHPDWQPGNGSHD